MTYNPALDGLRALAVLAVLLFHCRFPPGFGGFIGVDVFFVLSGYLITSLLRAEVAATGRIDLLRFYLWRALRLCPALMLMLAAYALVAPALFPEDSMFRDVALAGLYLTDYSFAFWDWPDKLSHTWSLAVEQRYYLIWPLVVIATCRLSPHSVAWIFAALFVAASAWRICEVLAWGSWQEVYYRFDTRLSGLIMGSLVAILPWRPGPHAALVLSRFSMIVLGLAFLLLHWELLNALTWPAVLIDLAAGALVMSLVSGHQTPIGTALSARALVYLGSISYGIYLWHYPIVRAVRENTDPVSGTFVVVVLSIGAATLSYRFVEKPLLARRSRPAVQVA
ncbi:MULTISPECIES: acyltransferase family protein [Aminobacter]|uniref:Acyltransferase 3 n=3 Tax=Aminobacter TaxID=31988 RepID=A0AAC9FCV2_AMIAI|nr:MULTISPECIES: acyltransferase [Aminobacter]AMS39315.1 Acyltransferase 3 [Aminobacter aminovorans]MBA8910193.1 peptidoglycan/LPS O-acetylase OafA/YrhL [Aminobacter ciceronei]MBA9023983.1 peptidoglycan/LPS O-acetylase OafA/YrhL [Aminobacter ciceronei]MBB3709926.1 peptidoglycan/LPS O-acetylase OafA/YrhL [Aminobacter aminovorans]MBB6470383.1 peptidoglycan/LPS O-acetylase OafA/YrhL [Aminobacter lissarensis]